MIPTLAPPISSASLLLSNTPAVMIFRRSAFTIEARRDAIAGRTMAVNFGFTSKPYLETQ
jgi:hypothetical protein